MLYNINDLSKIIEDESSVNIYLSNISAKDFIADIKSILTKKEAIQKLPKRSIDDRKDEFKKELAPFLPIYGKDMLNEFYTHWSELNRSKTMMKFEREDTWETHLRLKKWSRNNFGNKKILNQQLEQAKINLK